MYENRREAAAACDYEGTAASHYSKIAIEYAREGECRKAWKLADTARIAATCAMQAHDALWELAGEDMTEEEFNAFEKAEIGFMDAGKAEKAAAAAVEKLNAKRRVHPELAELCESTGTSVEGIETLMKYYTETCGWQEDRAIEHIKRLFADGTIEALKMIK